MLEHLLQLKMEKMREVHAYDREIWRLLKKHGRKIPRTRYFVLKARLHERKTLEEVAKELQVTRERVRQIEQASIIQFDAFAEQNK